MKKISVLLCGFALTLIFTATVLATPPETGSFTIHGETTNPGEFTQTANHVKIRGLEAAGVVTFAPGSPLITTNRSPFTGTFTYTENINANIKQAKSTQQGWMTITVESVGTIDIHFVGQANFTSFTPPEGTVVDQPFTVIGGTGAYANLRGQGTRTGNAGSPFTVVYTGRFNLD